jgi:hypothetical protein
MTNPFQILQDVADAVVAELNAGNAAGSFSMAFTAARTYDAHLEMEQTRAKSLSVDVLFGVPEIRRATVVSDGIVCPIDICVRKQVVLSDTNTIDGLVAFTGELWAYLAGSGTDGFPRSLSTYNTADWEDPPPDAMPWPYVPELLNDNLYAGILHTFYVVHA